MNYKRLLFNTILIFSFSFADDCRTFISQDECNSVDGCEWNYEQNNCSSIDTEESILPECVMDCVDIESVDFEENKTEFCNWLINLDQSCLSDCDDETFEEVIEVFNFCNDCLESDSCEEEWEDDEEHEEDHDEEEEWEDDEEHEEDHDEEEEWEDECRYLD
ncbi:MAG: hypothetical protein CMF80_04795, partial [Candidatus Marinimicrobia bacterium]|nr:hypothetical protein [Candidatus Neomarinimicrobiota bacterium]